MGKLTSGQILFLVALVMALGLLTSLAIAKWAHEKKMKARRLAAANAKKSAASPPPSGTP